MNLGATAVCLLAMGLFAQPLMAADGPPAELAALAEHHRAAKTLSGTFTYQVRPILDGEAPSEPPRTGSFAIRAAGEYSIVVREAAGGAVDRWLSNGRNRWEISQLSPEDKADIRGPFACDDGDADYRRIVACLRLDLDTLAKDHVLGWAANATGSILSIRPQNLDDQAKGPQVAAITIQLTTSGEPAVIDLDHNDGNRWHIVLTTVKRDDPVEDRMFQP